MNKEEKELIRYYCASCKSYISSEEVVGVHSTHKTTDLAQKTSHYLARYQYLLRIASLLLERKRIYIKKTSLDDIMEEIKEKYLQFTTKLDDDIVKTIDRNNEHLLKNHVINEVERVKSELTTNEDEKLTQMKNELGDFCKSLLSNILENEFKDADNLIEKSEYEKYEREIKEILNKEGIEIDLIYKLNKLKQTKIKYSYDPLAIMGMIKVNSLVYKQPRVLQFDREVNSVNIYYINAKKTVPSNMSIGFILPFRFMGIETLNNVYINGGDNDYQVYFKSHYLYEEMRGGLIPLADMNEARTRHALASIDDKNRIYAIGGENKTGVLKKSEYYDIKENKWITISTLNEPRCGLSACTLDSQIYIIGGWNLDYLSSMERLDTSSDSNKWEIVNLNENSLLKPGQIIGAIGIKDNEILIFGGYQADETLVKSCYLLNVDTMVLAKKNDLQEGDGFIASEVKRIENIVYGFGYDKGGLHFYDIVKDEWGFISQEDLRIPDK